jgi:hypothetical protein
MWSLIALAGVAATLQVTGTAYWWWREIPIETQKVRLSGHGPYGYVAPNIALGWLSQTDTFRSPARLFENDRRMALANTLHDDIGQWGRGRFSFWHGAVYFSASDNTDPRSNGRRYTLQLPVRIRTVWLIAWWGAVMILGLALSRLVSADPLYLFKAAADAGFKAWAGVKSLPPAAWLVFCGAAVIAAFLVARLPWFVDYRLPLIQNDTYSYFAPLRKISQGSWPSFEMRTPGYPMFLGLSLLLSPRLMTVVVLQNLLTLASVLFFVWSIYRAHGRFIILASIAMIGHVAQPLLSQHDFAILSESLYTSCLLFAFGMLFLLFRRWTGARSALFSGLCGFAFWIRPSAVFFLGLVAVLVIHRLVVRAPAKTVLALALPMPAMILVLLLYNYATLGAFAISRIGYVGMYGMTASFWEPDDRFPPEVNKSIEDFRTEVSEADRNLLLTSWRPARLNPVFTKLTVYAIYDFRESLFSKKAFPDLREQQRWELAQKVAFKAIARHPAMMAKFFYSTLATFLVDSASWASHFFNNLAWTANRMYFDGLAKDPFVAREFQTPPIRPALHPDRETDPERIVVETTGLARFSYACSESLRKFFDNKIWLVLYLLVWLASLALTLRSGFRHPGAVLVFAVSSCLLASGIVVALTTTMTNRYPSPTRFIEILSVALVPLFWKGTRSGPSPGAFRTSAKKKRCQGANPADNLV